MAAGEARQQSRIYYPPYALTRDQLAPILYLAERLSRADTEWRPRERRVADVLAEAAGLDKFRTQPWFRELNEAGAVQQITSPLARRAALVILSLVLKAHELDQDPEELAWFSRIRSALGEAPVTVPRDLDGHMALALAYVRPR